MHLKKDRFGSIAVRPSTLLIKHNFFINPFSDKLLIRMTQGLGSSRYVTPDYEKLKALTLEKKITGNRSLIKVNRLAAISKASQPVPLYQHQRSA